MPLRQEMVESARACGWFACAARPPRLVDVVGWREEGRIEVFNILNGSWEQK